MFLILTVVALTLQQIGFQGIHLPDYAPMYIPTTPCPAMQGETEMGVWNNSPCILCRASGSLTWNTLVKSGWNTTSIPNNLPLSSPANLRWTVDDRGRAWHLMQTPNATILQQGSSIVYTSSNSTFLLLDIQWSRMGLFGLARIGSIYGILQMDGPSQRGSLRWIPGTNATRTIQAFLAPSPTNALLLLTASATSGIAGNIQTALETWTPDASRGWSLQIRRILKTSGDVLQISLFQNDTYLLYGRSIVKLPNETVVYSIGTTSSMTFGSMAWIYRNETYSSTPTTTLSRTLTQSFSKTPTYVSSQSTTKAPTQSSSHTLTFSSSNTPTQSSSHTPTYVFSQSTTKAPTQTPTYVYSQSTTKAPTQSPTQSSSYTPTYVSSHTTSNAPSHTPTYSPSKTPIESPIFVSSQSTSQSPTPAQPNQTLAGVIAPSSSPFTTQFASILIATTGIASIFAALSLYKVYTIRRSRAIMLSSHVPPTVHRQNPVHSSLFDRTNALPESPPLPPLRIEFKPVQARAPSKRVFGQYLATSGLPDTVQHPTALPA